MKEHKAKNYPSKEEHFQFRERLSLLTEGKNVSIERILVRQILSFRERWPDRENDFKELLFIRMVSHDADFFRTMVEEMEHIQRGSNDHWPQAAAVLRCWFGWRERTGDIPTANELFDFLILEERACRNWKRLDDRGRSDPSLPYMRVMRYILRRLKLRLKPEKRGRKPKLRK